ncbi:MAG: glycogen debranching protein GlgX [Planctomycetota bacterium]|jgi:glycogen operon protein|nr:glycogen debranching protein GlgX [Planctomycetota bacterium]
MPQPIPAGGLTSFYPRDEGTRAGKEARLVAGLWVDRGSPLPLGPNLTAHGVNFAVVAGPAVGMRLELFRADAGEALAEIDLDPRLNRTGDVWHLRVLNSDPDWVRELRYVWKAGGPRNPAAGLYYDPAQPLLDPYARAFSGVAPWGRADLARSHDGVHFLNRRRCRVVSPRSFDWDGDVPPLTPLEDTVIYELHVRGYTVHPGSGITRPGTFIGLAEKIPYLKELGVTAVELMPVFEFDENENLRRHPRTGRPLLNFWGYSPIGFFCPNAGYAAAGDAGAMNEFREMVRRFHRAGLEIILDVVFNHTAEGDERGPTLSFRGLDNPTYYMLDEGGKYRNYSGCGNTFNCNHPVVRILILDVLRYWTAVMHVDGFRFDLASILGRDTNGEVLPRAPLLEVISLDPVLARVKLIAEAWDAAGLNQVGNFPSYGRWSEWNGYYRDDVRRFWRGDKGMVSRFASRICGSDDLYRRGDGGGRPGATVNFVTAHDGFTLNDLVSYDRKHNEDNGEGNRDGEDHNHSRNFGIEGPTGDAGVNRRRRRQIRNFLATLFLSQGVPMLLGGDEFARGQGGNNNAYCQDNEISWLDWSLAEKNSELVRFVRLLVDFRRRHPILRRRRFFGPGGGISWHGERENAPDWSDGAGWLSFVLDGGQALRPDGGRDDDIMFIANASEERRHFAVPDRGGDWRRVVDTFQDSPGDIFESADSAPNLGRRVERLPIEPGSLAILVRPVGAAGRRP